MTIALLSSALPAVRGYAPDSTSIALNAPPRTSLNELAALSATSREIGNQDQWEEALGASAASEPNALFASFGEPRYRALMRITAAGLKGPAWEAAPLDVFLHDPRSFIDPVGAQRIHLFVEPADGVHGKRLRFKDITVAEALLLCDKLEHLPNPAQFVATVVEAPQLLFHGNFVVSPPDRQNDEHTDRSGSVVGEFVSGESDPVSRGATPEFRLWREPYLRTFRYSFEDGAVRALLYEGLKLIPRQNGGNSDSFRYELQPGYYEVGIAADGGSGTPRAYLYDMKPWGAA